MLLLSFSMCHDLRKQLNLLLLGQRLFIALLDLDLKVIGRGIRACYHWNRVLLLLRLDNQRCFFQLLLRLGWEKLVLLIAKFFFSTLLCLGSVMLLLYIFILMEIILAHSIWWRKLSVQVSNTNATCVVRCSGSWRRVRRDFSYLLFFNLFASPLSETC